MTNSLIPRMKVGAWVLFLAALAVVAIPCNPAGAADPSSKSQSVVISIGGGPAGGTFRHIAGAIAEYVSQTYPDIEMFSETSGGSMENIRRLNSAKFDFAIAYAADISLGARGKLPEDTHLYDKVKPVGYLYGAPVQLVVRAGSGIKSTKELAGRKVAVGNPGSGAALSAERFLKHSGVWTSSKNLYLGYSTAAKAFNNGRIDAFWVLVGYPNASVIEAAMHQPINLLPVGSEAAKNGFYKAFGFYTPVTIPAGVYKGVDKESPSFQDSALLCTRTGVDDALVYKITKAVWSAEGLAHLRKAHRAAKNMAVANGTAGIQMPVAKGAARFWQEKNVKIPKVKKSKK